MERNHSSITLTFQYVQDQSLSQSEEPFETTMLAKQSEMNYTFYMFYTYHHLSTNIIIDSCAKWELTTNTQYTAKLHNLDSKNDSRLDLATLTTCTGCLWNNVFKFQELFHKKCQHANIKLMNSVYLPIRFPIRWVWC